MRSSLRPGQFRFEDGAFFDPQPDQEHVNIKGVDDANCVSIPTRCHDQCFDHDAVALL
jgi:hypothetical protein